MSWNNPFRKADVRQQGVPVQQQQQVQQQPTPQNKNVKATNSSTVPDNSNTDKTSNNEDVNNDVEGDDPLLKFDSIWQPNVDKDGKPIQNKKNAADAYLPPIDPEKLRGMVDKMDFTRNITKEERAAIAGGGEGAVEAMFSVLNKTQRQSFVTALTALSRLTEHGFQNAQGRFVEQIPDHVRNLMTEDGMSSVGVSSAILKNPAFAPLVQGVRRQYLQKFPKATPSEVTGAVNAYFQKMYDDMNSAVTQTKQQNTRTRDNNDKLRAGDPTADFSKWLEGELGGGTSDDVEVEPGVQPQ